MFFHHFGAGLASNTSLDIFGTIPSCATKRSDSCGCFTGPHSPAFWNLEKSCVEKTLISNATRPTWINPMGGSFGDPNISGQGVENRFLTIHQLHLQTRLLFLAGKYLPTAPVFNGGKVRHRAGDVSTISSAGAVTCPSGTKRQRTRPCGHGTFHAAGGCGKLSEVYRLGFSTLRYLYPK